MPSRPSSIAVSLSILVALVVSCGGRQEAHGTGLAAPAQGPPALAGRGSPAPEGEASVAWAAPAGWVEEKPRSAMRRAQYRVPGPGGDAECAVFYFGPGQGGDPASNVERWAAQFRNPDGSPATDSVRTSRRRVGGLDVVTVEAAGTYDPGSSMGAPPEPKPGHMLLGAIAEGHDASWFFKLTGPETTVASQRASFERLIDSLKRAE